MRLIVQDTDGTELARRDLAPSEVAALLDSLAGAQGIADWVLAMVAGKIEGCATRMSRAALDLARAGVIDAKALPDLSNASLISALAAHPAYKDRSQREAQGPALAGRP